MLFVAMSPKMTIDVAALRKEYTRSGLRRKNLHADPFVQFKIWFEEAIRTAGNQEANAMTLATATKEGIPSARVVLLKGFDRGFVFFTNYESRKAQDLLKNPYAALNFHWPWLERQVQVQGSVEKTSREESESYFRKRPLGSRMSAIISKQSSVIESRAILEKRLNELGARYVEGAEPPLPDFWGGFRVIPTQIEFWQGRENRLHDRFLYTLQSDAGWRIDRLSP
jgi:pyridoxamine 5'-phosphate oxidase